MKNLCFVLVIGCAVLTTVFAGGSGDKKASGEDFVLTIGLGVQGGLCAAPFYIAIEKGFYEEEGLKYKEFKMDPGTTMNHLTAGNIDVSFTLLATVIQPLANGLDVKIPLALHTGCIKVMVTPDSPITSRGGLKGKKIGVASMNDSSKMIASRVLASQGLKVDGAGADVEWVIYPSTELALALERGLVDAIGISDPAASIIEKEGKARVIINSTTDADLKDEFCCVVLARSSTLAAHPETTAKFLRAIQKAAKFVEENPEEAARIITEKKYIAGEAAVNGQVLAGLNYRASVSQALSAIERNARELQQIGLVASDVDVNALVKNTFTAVPGVPDSLF
jgi:NitT/TauT family transport system substrate-binding protein